MVTRGLPSFVRVTGKRRGHLPLGPPFPGMDGSRTASGSDQLLTATQVGKLLGVPASWVYEQSRRGRIPTVTLGRYRRYRRAAIALWIEQIDSSPRAANSGRWAA